MIIGGIIKKIKESKNAQLKGTVVLMRKNVLDLNDFGASLLDGIGEFLGKGITCQLISSTLVDTSKTTRPPLCIFLATYKTTLILNLGIP